MHQINFQAPEKLRTDLSTLGLINVFRTIQGEGPWAGIPAIFVRLAGCNLQCPNCDTDYTTGRRTVTLEALVEQVDILRMGPDATIDLVVITGGEPFRQEGVYELAKLLSGLGCRVQFETNGTFFNEQLWETHLDACPMVTVVVSPKTARVHPEIWRYTQAAKYVVEDGCVSDSDGLPTSVLGYTGSPARPSGKHIPIFVQPMDAQDETANLRNLQAAVDSCLQFGHRLSVQSHKIASIP